ncbi:hypothetical protein [Virgisporangium aurantiacum]|uniref:Uncharacterized protein n=1 Tax=Virgisporangium aurantiacum TaxID=175570 RepID=A0A8J4DZH3_9ACTN|nr:hypothetical protein [Virgisporangium aurantiacum]GIJ56725.1 hypothetical protein Vau01_042410 [Virgisporangium aurantiacum]
MNEPEGGHVDPADAALLDRLRPLVEEDDPVPPAVTAAAKAASTWRRIDEELAELGELADLTGDSLSLAAGVRGGATRLLTYEAGDLTVEIEVSTDDDRIRILGQVVPAGALLVRVEQPAQAVEVGSDELGRFRATGLSAGPTRLSLTPPGGAPVRTQWTLL